MRFLALTVAGFAFALTAQAVGQQADVRTMPREPQRFQTPSTARPLAQQPGAPNQVSPSQSTPNQAPTQLTPPQIMPTQAATPVAATPSNASPHTASPIGTSYNEPPIAQALHQQPIDPVRPGAKSNKPLSLARRGETSPRVGNNGEELRRPSTAPSFTTVGASLAMVLGLFFVSAWALRRGMPSGAPTLPSEVVEVLGRTPLTGRQHAHLIRLGNKLVLVSLSAGGAETIAEVTDPVEVDRLAGLCQSIKPQSSTDAFLRVFQQFSRQKAPSGFLGAAAANPPLVSATANTLAEEDADV